MEGVSVAAPPYTAYLRVYEPLAAFPPAEQERWRAYAAAGQAPSRVEGPRQEHEQALATLLAVHPPKREEEAFVRTRDGVTVVCPWRTRIRSWEAVLTVRSGVAEVLADAFVPRVVADVTEAEAEAFRADHPQARSHIIAANWAVPVRWFVLFDGAERELVVQDERSLVYTTEMSRARRRAARALSTLRKSLGEETAITVAVEEVARWLEDFHPRSLVELDYGGLVNVLSADALRADCSAEDVADALAGLAEGDESRASAAYERVVERWRPAQLVENAN